MSKKSQTPYHHGDLREALVSAALQLLETEGLEGISTRALARHLGVSHAAPTRHFPDRAIFLAEVAAAAFEGFTQVLGRAVPVKGKPTLTLASLGRAYVRFAIDKPEHLRLMFTAGLNQLDPLPERLARSQRAAMDVLQNAIAAVLGPAANDASVQAATLTAWSHVHGAAMLWINGPLQQMMPANKGRAAFLSWADDSVQWLADNLKA